MELIYLISMLIFILSIINFFRTPNLIIMLISVELMLNALNIILVRTITQTNSTEMLLWFIAIVSVAAAEAGIGFAIIILISKKLKSVNADLLTKIKETFR